MTKCPTISIIIPVYNIQDYLGYCVDSISQHVSPEIEVILVDDGSTDESGNICDLYAQNSHIQVIHQKNQGVSIARNNGLKKAKGEYVYFVDGDDILAPNALKIVLNKIAVSGADVISGTYVKFFDPNKIPSGNRVGADVIQMVESKKGHEALREMLKSAIFLPNMSTNVFRRSLFDKNNIKFEPGVVNTEDLNCGMQLYVALDKIAVLQDPIYYYRQSRRGSATSTVSKKRVEDLLDFIDKWVHRIENFREDNIAKIWLRDYISYQYIIALGLVYLCPRSDRKTLIARATSVRSLFASGLTKKTRFASWFYTIFGLSATGRLLSGVIVIKRIFL